MRRMKRVRTEAIAAVEMMLYSSIITIIEIKSCIQACERITSKMRQRKEASAMAVRNFEVMDDKGKNANIITGLRDEI